MSRPSRRRGFTLLEVMISLAILAVAMVAIGDINGGAVQMHYYARRSTQATLLLRGKMLDIEEQLTKDGFHEFDDEQKGTFEEEGAPEYAWRAEILRPDIQLDDGALLSLLGLGNDGKSKGDGSSSGGASTTGGLAGAAGSGGTLSSLLGAAAGGLQGLGLQSGQLAGGAGLAAMGGPLSGLMQGQAKTFIETLKKSVREVRLTITWKDGGQQRELSASQQIVILPESVGRAGQANPNPIPGATTTGQPGLPGLPGLPGFNPGTNRNRVSGDGSSQ